MKQQLRKKVLAWRSSLDDAQRCEKSIAIADRVKWLLEYQKAQTVMLYLDFRGEVETTALVQDTLDLGKRVVIPVCNPDHTITPVEIRNLTEDIGIGTWGIREAKVTSCLAVEPQEIDLVVVPGVGFDRKGNRLGYGAGYYDRFIPTLRRGVPLVALAFEVQILANFVPDPHDRPMDLVVTEDDVIQCTNADF